MSTSEVVAVVAATVVAMLVAILAVVLVVLARTLRQLRTSVEAFHDEALTLLDEARASVDTAVDEVDRIDRLVTSAERLGETKRAIATPVVKAMAFGSGVSRAAQRLREGEPAKPSRASRARRRSAS
jgi:hypothetical protein